MKEKLCHDLLEICPGLKSVNGYLLFGSLESAPPYHNSSYIHWRIGNGDYPEIEAKSREITRFINHFLEYHAPSFLTPHGYFKFVQGNTQLVLTTRDIVDTILDKVEHMAG